MISFLTGGVIAGITFYMALIYGSAPLGLIGFSELGWMLIAFLDLLFIRKNIRADIQIPISVADAGKRVNVRIVTQNDRMVPGIRIRYRIVYKNSFAGPKKKFWISGEIQQRGTQILEQRVVPGRVGQYVFALKKIRVYDRTGLFYLHKKIGKSASVQVLPELTGIAVRVSEQIRNHFGEADIYDDFRPGEDNSSIFDVREYRAGDRLQKIHWKLSAKSDELLVREDSQPLACAVVLLLDSCPLMEKRKWLQRKSRQYAQEDRAEAFLGIAAGIAYSLMDAACPHYVSWYSRTRQEMVRLRVDDEESLYLFLHLFLTDGAVQAPLPVNDLYEEKYRYDRPVHRIEWTQQLVLRMDGKVLANLNQSDWKNTFAHLELVL